MSRIALIVNERSGKPGDPVRDQLCNMAQQSGILWARTNDIIQAEIALKTFALEGVDTLVIYGGDGTLDIILSLIRRENIFTSEPRIALLRGGTTNMTYRDAGLHGKPIEQFEHILNGGVRQTIKRPVIRVQQAQEPDYYGFFFGMGAVPRAIEATRKKLHTKGMKGPVSEALMVSSLLQRLVAGKIEDHPILKPSAVRMETNEDPPSDLTCVYMIVSTLDKLLLNLRPALSTPNKLGIMALTYPYRQLFKYLGPLLNAKKAVPESSGIWRQETGAFTLAFDGPWTLDGEMFTANAADPLRLSIDAPVTFCVAAKPAHNPLQDYIRLESFQAPPVSLDDLIAKIRSKAVNPDGIAAILLYGSGLWKAPEPDTVWDLYVLTDQLRDYDRRALVRFAGHVMPPNVYYTQDPMPCKFGVLRLDQFARGCSLKSWKPQIWARFSQPCTILYARDEAALNSVTKALSDAVLSFHLHALPFVENPNDPRALWVSGLKQTYASELRSEDETRAKALFDAQEAAFAERTKLALPLLNIRPEDFTAQRLKTKTLRPLLKFLYVLQIIKASMIFENGVDYALWKIKRHSGMEFTATKWQKKYPLIFGWSLLWKIYKAGGLR